MTPSGDGYVIRVLMKLQQGQGYVLNNRQED